MPADHYRFQPCPDRRAVRQLQRDAVSAYWRFGTPHGGMLFPSQGRVDPYALPSGSQIGLVVTQTGGHCCLHKVYSGHQK
mmetsp:Transcript_97594/g.173814  ORF Transcript_97594/g.173814 Transcript_97594/m.173814 type:complete len:80 (-) Transcript_97594:83-322(-)